MKTKTLTPVEDAYRYLKNSKEAIKKTEVKDGFYEDPKYVKTACNIAYSGLLVAVNELFRYKGIEVPKRKKNGRQPMNVDFYVEQLGKINRKMMKNFNSAYDYLHLFGGYDGNTKTTTYKTGFELAKTVIDWISKQVKY